MPNQLLDMSDMPGFDTKENDMGKIDTIALSRANLVIDVNDTFKRITEKEMAVLLAVYHGRSQLWSINDILRHITLDISKSVASGALGSLERKGIVVLDGTYGFQPSTTGEMMAEAYNEMSSFENWIEGQKNDEDLFDNLKCKYHKKGGPCINGVPFDDFCKDEYIALRAYYAEK